MATRSVYILSYDIAEDKRRTRVYQYLRGWGDHLQYSVFRLVLGAPDLERVRSWIHEHLHHEEDQVILFNLGPEAGRALGSVESIGLPYTHPERHALIV